MDLKLIIIGALLGALLGVFQILFTLAKAFKARE